MSPKPRREPHVMVAATISRNSKLAALPSDAARLGYFYAVLGEAKLLRPQGRFASIGQWREVAGRFARFLPQYLAVELMEQAPDLCKRCAPRWGELPVGTLVVHDWHEHQTDPGAAGRAEDWRQSRGQADDEPPFDERSMPVQSAFDERSMNDEPPARRDVPARARREVERRTEKRELDSLGSSGGNAHATRSDDADPAFTLRQWLAAHNAPVRDGDGYHTRLVRYVATGTGKTTADVIAAFERLQRDGAKTAKQYVMGAEDLLFPTIKTGNGKAPSIDVHKYDHMVESGDEPRDGAAKPEPPALDDPQSYIGGGS